MKQHIDKSATTDTVHGKKPRFKIEKLEERIAPRKGGCSLHYNPHGKLVGHYGRGCYR